MVIYNVNYAHSIYNANSPQRLFDCISSFSKGITYGLELLEPQNG